MSVKSEIADFFNPNRTDHPYWSESSWFSYHIPEDNINGSFYNHFRPNMNCMLAGTFMWDHSGENACDCLYYDWQAMRVPPEGVAGRDYEKYDFKTPWGMSIAMLEPVKRYRLGYEREGIKLDLTFEGIAEVHSIPRIDKHGFRDAYNFHFEQPGRIAGIIELKGRRYEVDSFSIRDGSHGPRFLEKVTPGGYTWSTGSRKTAWHFMAANTDNSKESRIVGGYLLRDGKMASITQGVRRVLERNGPRPSVVEVEAVDAEGRKLEAVGRVKVPSTFILFPDRGMYWQQFAWDYDGIAGAIGEDQEYYGLHDFREWNRAGPSRWTTR